MARINRCIELLEQGQPLYYGGVPERSFEAGVKAAQTYADYLNYEMEHMNFDFVQLAEFMRGIAAGGPTKTGHRMPTVITTLPMEGRDEQMVRTNAWMIKQALATGVHGILLCHAETPDAVRAFVEEARYPFHKIGVGKEGIGEGRRRGGGQAIAAAVWGLTVDEYLERADVWRINPKGEIMLGLKIENSKALDNAEQTLAVPGITFAEWGPGDMGMSLGYPNSHDEPWPKEMEEARARVLAACKANGVAFLSSSPPEKWIERIQEGVMICGGRRGAESAELGRRYTKRTMPW